MQNINNRVQTIGRKLVSVLRYPLFTIPYPVEKKDKPQTDVKLKKAVEKSQCPTVSAKPSFEPAARRNTQPKRNSTTRLFTPFNNKEVFEKMLFVLRACDKKASRAFTNVLHIERAEKGSRLVATDGRRMHIAVINSRIKPGDYKPVVTKGSINLGPPIRGVMFPNWKQVVPSNAARCGCVNLENNTVIGETSPVYNSFVRQAGVKVNPRYLADLTKKPWTIYRNQEKQKPLLLKESGAENETYAVMVPLAA